jgi:dCMP deaminase
MSVAQVIAHRSLCVRARVGAVIVDTTNRVVAVSYNGPPTGFEHGDLPCTEWCERARHGPNEPTHYDDCPSLHAEANALSVCDRSLREGGTIYVTTHVCIGCGKLIANSGLKHLVIPAVIDGGEHREAERTYTYLRSIGVQVRTVR